MKFSGFVNKISVDCRSTVLNCSVEQKLEFQGCSKI